MKSRKLFRFLQWTLLLVFAGTSVVSLQGCFLMKKKYEKTEVKEYNFSTKNTKRFAVDNPNGNVVINRNSTDSIVHIKAEITTYVTKKELDQPLKGIKIDIDTTGDEIRLRDIVNKESGEFVFFNFRHGSKVNYEISIPANIELKLSSTNGKIRLEELNNDVNADLTNGSIKMENVFGNLRVDITNGSINAKIDSTKGINFETVNGSITLEVGENFNGNFRTETVNGKVTKRNVSFKETEESKREFKGVLGDGKPDVKLQTVNGSIKIEKK
jgi:DUF4097 and DUF4098 domain-containing protein YvlB